MTPEEVAKKHCYNGHDPERCSLLADIRNLVSQEREQAATFLDNAARSFETGAFRDSPVTPQEVTDLAAAIRSGIHASETKG